MSDGTGAGMSGTGPLVSGRGRRPTGGVGSEKANMAQGEYARLIDSEIEVSLSPQLRALRDHITERFDDLVVDAFRGELTFEIAPEVAPERLIELLQFCRDDPQVRCELLADLSALHWPGGERVERAPETTGWPTYEFGEEDEPGHIEVDYILYSLAHNHRLRMRVLVPDDAPRLPTATGLYGSADVMEREVFDFFGVEFEGHPRLERILMPEDWEGHPLRKDYPLGGVEVQYKGASVPPPDERIY